MRIEKITITSQEASRMLENNNANRPLRLSVVSSYAKQMMNGEWQLNGESIKFSSTGELKDGQHRLSACVKANVPFETYVIYDDDCTIFDVGAKRTVVDIAKLSGCDAHLNSTIAATVKLYLMKSVKPTNNIDLRTDSNRPYAPTVTEMIEYISENQDKLEIAYRAVCKGASNPICKKSAIMLACYYAVRDGVNPITLERFFEVVNSGFAVGKNESSAIVIRNNIVNKKLKSGAIETTKQVCFAIKDFVNGTPRTALYQANNKNVPYFRHGELLQEESL